MNHTLQGVLIFLVFGISSTIAIKYPDNAGYSYPYGTIGTVGSETYCQCKFNDTAFVNVLCGSSIASFMTTLQSLLMASCDIADPCRRIGKDEIPKVQRFDFIVVGAGVAGPVIASRLSEHWQVLLVEAGPDEPTLTFPPGLSFNAINSSLDWQYLTEPTEPVPTACLESGGRCAWPRGKMVSGTGGMYGMMYVRGHPKIYNQWAEMGNPGWSYAELEKYFEIAENPTNPKLERSGQFKKSNTNGPLIIDEFRHKPAFADELIKAAQELGYDTSGVRDYKQTGFTFAPMLTENGQRGTTSRYYLRSAHDNPNLHILTNAHVTRVLVEPWSKRVNGIELIDYKGDKYNLMASKEVILSAGAIGSPQILLQSGIGPAQDLHRLNIPVIKDLPGVGQNLHNHVSATIRMTIQDRYYETSTLSLVSVNEYMYNRSGPLSSTGLTQVTAFLESKLAEPGVPDLQIFFDGFSPSCVPADVDIVCPDGSINTCPERRKISVRPTVVRVSSRGYLTLRSNNPLEYPLIYPNYFTNDKDMEILIDGIKKILQLTQTQTMRKWDLRLEPNPHPWCSTYHFGTDAYWECMIRVQTAPENHQAGSCRMGPASDPTSVVDSQLRVIGVEKLRVADASIFPVVNNANPVAPIIAVAEKAAAMIFADYVGK